MGQCHGLFRAAALVRAGRLTTNSLQTWTCDAFCASELQDGPAAGGEPGCKTAKKTKERPRLTRQTGRPWRGFLLLPKADRGWTVWDLWTALPALGWPVR